MNKIHLTTTLLLALLVAPEMESTIDTLPYSEQSTQLQVLKSNNTCQLVVAGIKRADPDIVIGRQVS